MSSKYNGAPATHTTWIGTASPCSKRKPKGGNRGRAPLLTDAQILEMRALNEFAGWSAKRLQVRFAVNAEAVRRILQGQTRVNLIATRNHLPQDLEAA
jgi:hypothetical protein